MQRESSQSKVLPSLEVHNGGSGGSQVPAEGHPPGGVGAGGSKAPSSSVAAPIRIISNLKIVYQDGTLLHHFVFLRSLLSSCGKKKFTVKA